MVNSTGKFTLGIHTIYIALIAVTWLSHGLNEYYNVTELCPQSRIFIEGMKKMEAKKKTVKIYKVKQ